MSKKKKKGKKGKKDKKTSLDTISPSTDDNVTIIIPDAIADDVSRDVLHGIGRLASAATSTFDVKEIAVVKASAVPKGLSFMSIWMKNVDQE
jgi:hypothetical protein